jgi:hypothetical protein
LQATDEVVVGEGELGERGKGREAGEGVAADAAIAEAELLQGGEGRERLRGNQGRLISRGKGRSRARSRGASLGRRTWKLSDFLTVILPSKLSSVRSADGRGASASLSVSNGIPSREEPRCWMRCAREYYA